MNQLLALAVEHLDGMPDSEFRQKLSGNLFSELAPLLSLLPASYADEIKRISFSEVRGAVEEGAPEKARIITLEKKWGKLEEAFESIKKKV